MYIPKKKPVTDIHFEKKYQNKEAFYGLPFDLKYCQKCVISNQRPNSEIEYLHTISTKKKTIKFHEGICDACKVSLQKKEVIDWSEREKELSDICNKYRSKNGSYDCLVPGSGGKDSFYVSYILKHRYKMNPLTVTWAPLMPTEWGYKNMESWSNSSLDNIYFRPNKRVQRLLTRLSIENLFHPFQSFMFGQKLLAPKIASKFNLKLIFYGENQAEYGNDSNDLNSYLMKSNFFSTDELDEDKIFISGISIKELKKNFFLSDGDLSHYIPLKNDEIKTKNISVYFMSHFVKWHPQSNYYFAKKNSEFVTAPERLQGTYTKYVSTDDKMEYFNYFSLGVKYGIGWTSNTASYEIRDGDLTRSEGIDLVKKFDHEYPTRYLDEFLKFISLEDTKFPKKILDNFEQPIVDEDYFKNLTDSFRSPHIWKLKNNTWSLRFPINIMSDKKNEDQQLEKWKGNK